MAGLHEVWEIYWTSCEYGGPSVGAQPSYHLTREAAEAYKKEREGDRSVWPPIDAFYDRGSEPKSKLVSKAEFKKIRLQQ
jgi:hypothetical protein